MDVKEIQSAALSSAAEKKGKKEELNGLDFQKLLQGAQSNLKEGTGATPGGTAVGPEIMPEGVLAANWLQGIKDSSPLHLEGARAAERALDLLETYQRAMENPRTTLREIHPLVQSLAEEMKGLEKWIEKISPSDPLRGILREAGILSSIEIEKFNRGDYI
jgi:hypothetical protein